jgi:hypothetical protein
MHSAVIRRLRSSILSAIILGYILSTVDNIISIAIEKIHFVHDSSLHGLRVSMLSQYDHIPKIVC